jgi:hypothetical protein
MDQALALLAEARRSFQGVRDYECTLIKTERVRGELLPENVVRVKVRNQPYGVYLKWRTPSSAEGQEVCYADGRNGGKMRVHLTGLLRLLGFVSVDPLDPRAFAENRHPITEAGLGYLLDSTARYWEVERRLNRTEVSITETRFGNRPCTRIETVHPDRGAGTFYAYRCVLCLDKATHLPVHVEAYDWPHPGGPAGGDLLESYSFLDLRCNVGLGEEDFNH